ncbi:MAG: energy-coupling factor ABC transporter permease [bacterium]
MSHIHLPDGVLPFWLCLIGYLILLIYLIFYFNYIKKRDCGKKIVLASIMSAFMLITMSIELFTYHFNLSALSGILLGPVFAPIAILAVNIILAVFKHGGISTIGLNTVVVSTEAIGAYYIYQLLSRFVKVKFSRAIISTFLALILSSFISILVIYTGTHNVTAFIDHDHHEESVTKNHTDSDKHNEQDHNFNIKKFLLLILVTGGIGWTLESIFTAFIFDYINKVKPEVIALSEAELNENC